MDARSAPNFTLPGPAKLTAGTGDNSITATDALITSSGPGWLFRSRSSAAVRTSSGLLLHLPLPGVSATFFWRSRSSRTRWRCSCAAHPRAIVTPRQAPLWAAPQLSPGLLPAHLNGRCRFNLFPLFGRTLPPLVDYFPRRFARTQPERQGGSNSDGTEHQGKG